jgi:hypothetical protein
MNFQNQIESQFGLAVDQLLPDLSDITTPEDFADYLTLCVDELCDELISDIKNNEVTINIYARDVLFNSVNCLRSLGLNEYARIETLKIQNKFTELRKHKEIRLRHEFCSDRKCINRIEHVQRSVQKAYLNMMQAQSQKGQLILHAA